MTVFPGADPLAVVRAYHQRSKHGFGAYAPGPGHMDWATQPDPFRRYAGAEIVELPLDGESPAVAFADLYQAHGREPRSPTLAAVGLLLELSLGLSAWKAYGGDRWALRCNPSSGNLHPTEAYLVVGRGTDLAPGVYHYLSHDHVLECRCRIDLPFAGLLVGLTSIHWREAWKYGERAYRYCQHDAGHALAALRYAAAVLGWRMRLVDTCSDADLAALLGLEQTAGRDAEAEVPDLLAWLEWQSAAAPPPDIAELAASATAASWRGQPNRLSRRHLHHWPAIDEVHAAARKPVTAPAGEVPEVLPPLEPIAADWRAADLIRQRRSAQAFDGASGIGCRSLFRMLGACLPRPGIPPFDAWPWSPRLHLLLFIHRVEGLPPGLYLACRSAAGERLLRGAVKPEFAFESAEGSPPHLRLFRLLRANTRAAAKTLCCHQDIAADGAFSLGMLAEFDAVLESEGPWAYRRLFWEAGLIGQVLYLEAEAAGVRGTGIGCFFDDPVHEVLGLSGTTFQSLYHFTIGGPLVDDRLETLPPYAHLPARGRRLAGA